MTVRKNIDSGLIEVGNIIKNYRYALSLPNHSREYFIADRIEKGLVEDSFISVKTLSNIENGLTMPSLPTLINLSVALEIDFIELIRVIRPHVPLY